MLLHKCRVARIASTLLLLILLPSVGYIWAQPLTLRLVIAASLLSLLCVIASATTEIASSAVEGEVARLSEECHQKSREIAHLQDFNREDERLVEQLVLQNSELKGQLIASTAHDGST